MPRALPTELTDKLKAFNSEVKFSLQVTTRKDENGKVVLDPATNRPENDSVMMASLWVDGRPWCDATGGDEVAALTAALAKADTIQRPASTAGELAAERDKLREANAQLQAELDAIRKQNATIRAKPEGTQIKRNVEPVVPKP